MQHTYHSGRAFGLAKRAQYRKAYASLGYKIPSRYHNEPSKSAWRILSDIANKQWRWSNGAVYDFNSLADTHI